MKTAKTQTSTPTEGLGSEWKYWSFAQDTEGSSGDMGKLCDYTFFVS